MVGCERGFRDSQYRLECRLFLVFHSAASECLLPALEPRPHGYKMAAAALQRMFEEQASRKGRTSTPFGPVL